MEKQDSNGKENSFSLGHGSGMVLRGSHGVGSQLGRSPDTSGVFWGAWFVTAPWFGTAASAGPCCGVWGVGCGVKLLPVTPRADFGKGAGRGTQHSWERLGRHLRNPEDASSSRSDVPVPAFPFQQVAPGGKRDQRNAGLGHGHCRPVLLQGDPSVLPQITPKGERGSQGDP